MAVDPNYKAFVEDQLAGLGPVTIRPMFGGAGIYADGVMFGLIAFDTLYFKADDSTVPGFQAEGYGPFVYEGKIKPISMSYWQVPERLFEDADAMTEWAAAALSVARRSKEAKPGRRKKTGGAKP